MAKMIRVVFAGCGGISGAWMNALKTIPGVAVVGLVDLRAEAAEKRKAEFGYETARVGTDLNAMLKGDLEPATGFMMGKLKVTGDMSVAMRLQRVV